MPEIHLREATPTGPTHRPKRQADQKTPACPDG